MLRPQVWKMLADNSDLSMAHDDYVIVEDTIGDTLVLCDVVKKDYVEIYDYVPVLRSSIEHITI